MTPKDYISLVSVTLALVMAIINICVIAKNSQRTNGKDIATDEREMATILAELKNITSTTNEIKAEVSSMRVDTKENTRGIAVLEQSYKSEHKRLDEMVQRLLALEQKT